MKNSSKTTLQKAAQKIYQYRLNIMTVLVFIMPVFPLILISSFVLINDMFKLFSFDLSVNSLFGLVFLLWLLGGPAGLVGAVLALLKKYSQTSLILFIYGAVSYAILAIGLVFDSVRQGSPLNILVGAYLVFTLVIISIQMIKHYEKVSESNKQAQGQ